MTVNRKLIGLDTGETTTGVIILTPAGIEIGMNIDNRELFNFLEDLRHPIYNGPYDLVIEDIRPYNMKLTDGLINTIKYLGQLEWRLQEAGISFTLIPRWQVKQWVFAEYNAMAVPEIEKKIVLLNRKREKRGKPPRSLTATFMYVDDRIVQKAMRICWNIPKPRVGERAAYGLKDHSWQALGLISYYLHSYENNRLKGAIQVLPG